MINIEYEGVSGKFIPDTEYEELLQHAQHLSKTTDELFNIIVKQSRLLKIHNISSELMEGGL